MKTLEILDELAVISIVLFTKERYHIHKFIFILANLKL